jgi:hypothetical protein
MRKGARRGQSQIKKKGQSVGRHVKTPDRVPETHDGLLRLLALDNPMASAELLHQCEEGTVADAVFISLLERGYGKRAQKENARSRGKSLRFIDSDGQPWDKHRLDTTATQESTGIRCFTLGNALVRARLLYEWEEGIMRPAICKWFVAHGPELLKQTEPRRHIDFITGRGVPWLNDPMAEQQAAAIAKQQAQDKMEEQERKAREQEPQGPVAGEQETEEREVLELYRDDGDWG